MILQFCCRSVPLHQIPTFPALRWRHNGGDGVLNHQHHNCLLNRLFRRRSKKTSKLRVTSLCAWNSPGAGEFPAQMVSNAENVSIWWRHHGCYHTRTSWRVLKIGDITSLILEITVWSLSGEPDYFGRKKISSGGDLSYYSSASLY